MLNSNVTFSKFFIQSFFLFLFSLILLSCGGGGGGDKDNKDADNAGSGGSGGVGTGGGLNVSPVTPLTNKEVTPAAFGFSGFILESGFDGEIEYVDEKFQLSNGIPSMNVVEVEKVLAMDATCANGISFNGIISTVFSTGKVDLDAVVEGRKVSCTTTFQLPVPVTITGEDSIEKLLREWGGDFEPANAVQTGLIDTNCPSEVIDDNRDFNPFADCDGSFLTNYTVTDDSDGIHKIATKTSFLSTDSDPGQSDPGQFDPGQFDPGQFDPSQFNPGQFDPSIFGLNDFDLSNFDPNNFDPSAFIPNGFDPGEFPP